MGEGTLAGIGSSGKVVTLGGKTEDGVHENAELARDLSALLLEALDDLHQSVFGSLLLLLHLNLSGGGACNLLQSVD